MRSQSIRSLFCAQVIGFVAVAALVIALPETGAYERYNDGCQACHGAFTDETSPKGSVFPRGDKHYMHRNSQAMNTDCDLCHSPNDNDDPFIGSSAGTPNNPGLGCIGCHNDSGLRAHHVANSVTSCTPCHGNDPAPPAESAIPPYYGTADTNVDQPCNTLASAEVNENWTVGDFVGLDNDGDGLYDGNDPDCVAATCGNGQVEPGEDCDDGNTADGDCCSSTCSFEPSGSVCDDGLFCSAGETCDGAGSCTGGSPRDCGDGIGCTVDTCDEGSDSCLNNPENAACDDGLFCNGVETCDASLDCQDGIPVDCDDGDICTDDACNESTDRCENTFDPTNDPSCLSSECGNGRIEVDEDCDDGNTSDGDCCSSTCTFEPPGAPCNDGLYCNVDETCDGAGICAGGNARDCDDGVACTVDGCDEAVGACRNDPDDAACDDGLFCNGTETCNATLDCQAGAPVDCDDGDICTDDTCDESTSECDHVFDPSNDPNCQLLCPDGDSDGYSTAGDGCGPIDCNDSDASVNPGAAEICDDFKDNDCDGLVDAADDACAFDPATWRVRPGPLDDPDYAGSDTCGDCHQTQYQAWSESLHARMMIAPGDAQAAGFALPAADSLPATNVSVESWADVLFVTGQKWRTHYVDREGRLQGVRWNYDEAAWSRADNGELQPYDCGACHTTGFDADASYVDDGGEVIPGIAGSWIEYNIGCEACHGPGAEHVAGPTPENINRIVLDWTSTGEGMRTPVIHSAEVCGNCHYREPHRYDSLDSQRRNQTQFNDWSVSAHASSLQATAVNTYCAKCHSPGNAVYDAAEHNFTNFDPQEGTQTACISCHDPHGTSHERWSQLAWPGGGQQDPRDYQARLARYRGTDFNAQSDDYEAFDNGASNSLCTDCHTAQPGFRRHVDASPPAEVFLEPPYNDDEPVEVPHSQHVEDGYADCVDCHMAYSRQSMNSDDIRTHTMLADEWLVGGSIHYNTVCGTCHSSARDCSMCHSDFAAAGRTHIRRNKSDGRTDADRWRTEFTKPPKRRVPAD
jgi:cysteine-rich repeat protein